jgi:beta-lactamase class A
MRTALSASGKFALLCAATASLAGCSLPASLTSGDDCHEKYKLINSNRRCDDSQLAAKREYEEFETFLHGQIDTWKTAGKVESVAVYFRDMEGGPWFGIHEDMEFYPASLLKTPIMVTVLKLAEADPDILEETVSYHDPMPSKEDNAEAGERVEPDVEYPIRDVLFRMMAYSDNRSQQLLLRWLSDKGGGSLKILAATLDDIGLLPANGDLQSPLTVKSYSALFRSLYNVQYLGRDMSELGLEILANSNFKSGIAAGLPQGVKVAHKFGIWEDDHEKLLHDCGIVYHPSTPYLLCIMTRGQSLQRNADVISDLSELIYQEVELHDEPASVRIF